MYVVKPPVHIRFDEVSSVNFSRVASGLLIVIIPEIFPCVACLCSIGGLYVAKHNRYLYFMLSQGVGQSRSYDLEIETNTGANYIFASIEK